MRDKLIELLVKRGIIYPEELDGNYYWTPNGRDFADEINYFADKRPSVEDVLSFLVGLPYALDTELVELLFGEQFVVLI